VSDRERTSQILIAAAEGKDELHQRLASGPRKIVWTPSGLRALQLVRANRFDLIVVSRGLPPMGAVGFIRIVKQWSIRIPPVLLVSPELTMALTVSGVRAGARACVSLRGGNAALERAAARALDYARPPAARRSRPIRRKAR
jgi:CheY-like chemotaxis protein